MINDWNELPEDIVNTDSTDLFKTYLALDDIKKFAILKNRIGIEGQKSTQTS